MAKSEYYKISVIGQGFVGFPMSVVLSTINKKKIKVLGIEKDNLKGKIIKEKINNGILPFKINDPKLKKKFNLSIKKKNYEVSNKIKDIKNSDVIVVSIDADFKNDSTIKNIKKLFNKIILYVNSKTLIFIESTLPTGTCDKIIIPIFLKKFSKNKINLCYSYERVTPGENYFNSITNTYRSYAGANKNSKRNGKKFLQNFVNYKKYPLTELPSLIDCESAKIIENSYRAVNIAFIDEWTKFSNEVDINLHQIINSIKKRPTHSNIMRPGIGVGGYCLTKDPNFGKISSKIIYKRNFHFPFSLNALKINKEMINTSIDFIQNKTKIKKNTFLLIGATYKEDIGDFRNSPSINLAKKIKSLGGNIQIFDPYIDKKNINGIRVCSLKDIKKFSNILFCVKHSKLKKINFLNKKKSDSNIFDLCGYFKRSKIKNKRLYFLGG